MGAAIGAAGYPTVVVQEGGYRIRTLGINARHFFTGLMEGASRAKRPARPTAGTNGRPAAKRQLWPEAVKPAAPARAPRPVARNSTFSPAGLAIPSRPVGRRVGPLSASTRTDGRDA